MAVIIRQMAVEEFDRADEIDVEESGDVVFKYVNGDIVPEHEEWHRPPNSPARWNRSREKWTAMLERGGAALGAFDGDKLAGIAVVRYNLSPGMAQLAALYVDKDHRRGGVATRLVEEAARLARESGASALYVSATPSVSAVGFYRSQGFDLALEVNEELYALEPEDIHMVMPL